MTNDLGDRPTDKNGHPLKPFSYCFECHKQGVQFYECMICYEMVCEECRDKVARGPGCQRGHAWRRAKP